MPAQSWVTLIVGALAVVGVAFTVRQRTRADNRAQSWQRITWCLERTVSKDDDEAALGWKVFGTVARTPFIAATARGAQIKEQRAKLSEEEARVKASTEAFAKELASAHVPVRDIGALLGVTFQRASQLVNN